MTDQQYTPKTLSTSFVRDLFQIAAVHLEYTKTLDEAEPHFNRWLAAIVAAAEQRGAARELRQFAHAQDTWCAEGRAEQRISRIAMRDALLKRANELEGDDE